MAMMPFCYRKIYSDIISLGNCVICHLWHDCVLFTTHHKKMSDFQTSFAQICRSVGYVPTPALQSKIPRSCTSEGDYELMLNDLPHDENV